MIKMKMGKQFVTAVLALGVAVGCATAPEEPRAPTPSMETAEAIDAAKAAIAEANALRWIWRDTEELLAQAQAAAAEGDNATASKLANTARSQAELAVNQYYLEKAKFMFQEVSAAQGLSLEQQRALAAAGEAIRNAEGRKAYDLVAPLMAQVSAASMQYRVVRGDSLWSISGQQDVYGNPYQWPLIFKANLDQISDADLIYPGQMFSLARNPSAGEVQAAVAHARNRGAWAAGPVERSDRRYLGGTLQLY